MRSTVKSDPYFLESTFSILDGRLPSYPGVYAIVVAPKWDVNSTPVVVYIGSSHDLYDRFRCGGTRAHIYRRLKSLLKSYVVSIRFKEIRDHYKVEVGLIKKYRPRFNKVHNHG